PLSASPSTVIATTALSGSSSANTAGLRTSAKPSPVEACTTAAASAATASRATTRRPCRRGDARRARRSGGSPPRRTTRARSPARARRPPRARRRTAPRSARPRLPDRRSGSGPRARRASVALGQLALEDLAGGVARQLIEELDLARDLVAREVGLHQVLELVGVDRRPARDHDEGLQALAELLVLDADDRHLVDRVVVGQQV